MNSTEHDGGKTAEKIVVNFPCPVKFYDSSMDDEISRTPHPFRRIWFHTTDVQKIILSTGWNPECIKLTIYGTAVYLHHDKWDLDRDPLIDCLPNDTAMDRETLRTNLKDRKMIGCVLALEPNETQSDFPLPDGSKGNTHNDLIRNLNMKNLRVSKNARPGNSRQNREIAAYFLAKGTKAIKFMEEGKEVVAVYDPTCIRVLPKNTDLDKSPFPDIIGQKSRPDER